MPGPYNLNAPEAERIGLGDPEGSFVDDHRHFRSPGGDSASLVRSASEGVQLVPRTPLESSVR